MSEPKAEAFEVVVKDANNEEVRFRVRRNTVFSKVYAAYAKQKQIQEDSILFVYDGQRIQKDSTPESLDMEDGDVVDCQVHQLGGARS